MSTASGPGTGAGGSSRTGVIHDIGYRRYTGQREGLGGIILSLLGSGVLALFGFGRSGKAKALPFALLAFTAIVLGLQTVFFSFFMSAIAEKLQRDRLPVEPTSSHYPFGRPTEPSTLRSGFD